MVEWQKYDREDKAGTTPAEEHLVRVVEEFYEGGVTLGFFDGFTWRTWSGSDDCSVSAWAPIQYPAAPKQAEGATA
jgi:hypothetical protein